MAGFGRQLVRGLGAAMQGYGKTLTDQAAEQQRERALDGAMMRQKALADYQHGLSIDTLNKTAEANVAEHATNAATDTAEMIKRLGPTTDAKIKISDAENRQKFLIWQQQQSVEFKNKLSLQQQEQAFELAKQHDAQAHDTAMQEDRQQHDLDSNPIAIMEAADGTPVAFYGLGAKNRYTKMVGARIPRKGSEEGDNSLDSLRGGGSGGSSGGSRAGQGGAGVGPPPSAAPAPAESYTVYRGMLAEAATHPAFRDLSADEKIARVKALAKSQGIPVPPDGEE